MENEKRRLGPVRLEQSFIKGDWSSHFQSLQEIITGTRTNCFLHEGMGGWHWQVMGQLPNSFVNVWTLCTCV